MLDSAVRPAASSPPTIDAYDDGRGWLRAWCAYCNLWHKHTRHDRRNPQCLATRRERRALRHIPGRCTCPEGAGDGLRRVAHCFTPVSPFAETGYFLREAGTWDADGHRRTF